MSTPRDTVRAMTPTGSSSYSLNIELLPSEDNEEELLLLEEDELVLLLLLLLKEVPTPPGKL